MEEPSNLQIETLPYDQPPHFQDYDFDRIIYDLDKFVVKTAKLLGCKEDDIGAAVKFL